MSEGLTEYTLGFTFGSSGMPLMRKHNGPRDSLGINGFGGKLNEGEPPMAGMAREYLEETGILVEDWMPVCIIGDGKEYRVHVFAANITQRQLGDYKHMGNSLLMSWADFHSCVERGVVARDVEWVLPLCRAALGGRLRRLEWHSHV